MSLWYRVRHIFFFNEMRRYRKKKKKREDSYDSNMLLSLIYLNETIVPLIMFWYAIHCACVCVWKLYVLDAIKNIYCVVG